jgi:sec-independent protein translocase protein TatC
MSEADLKTDREQDSIEEMMDLDESAGKGMSFLDHLEELRWRILWSLGSVLLGTIVGFVVAQHFGVIDFIISPVAQYMDEEKLVFTKPTEPFFVTFKIAFLLGIVFALPIVFYHFWAFVTPALLNKERLIFFPAILSSVVLFSIGVYMAFGLVLPVGLKFLLSFQPTSLKPMITIGEYLNFATHISFAFGLVFELPLVVSILSWVGILTPKYMRDKRRHAYVIIFILSALLTPADVASMVMMAIPLALLFEFSIFLSAVISARRIAIEPEKSGG